MLASELIQYLVQEIARSGDQEVSILTSCHHNTSYVYPSFLVSNGRYKGDGEIVLYTQKVKSEQ